jgi:hypothetical protein
MNVSELGAEIFQGPKWLEVSSSSKKEVILKILICTDRVE